MWTYNRMLEFPVNIKTTNPKLAMAIMSQIGGPNGEKGASTRYLSQRYAMPDKRVVGVLTDIGTEEPVPTRCKYKIIREYVDASQSQNYHKVHF